MSGTSPESAAAGAAPVIAVRDLRRTYGKGAGAVEALRGVSFTIAPGEWVSIMGPSGSGKTTLLNVLGALDARYAGSVRIAGEELRSLRDGRLSKHRGQSIGFVFQQFNLLPHLSVLENVVVPGFFNASGAAENLARARVLLERVGLGDKLDALPSQLSGGQQQRVAIARALLNRAGILLCDEPTGALDRQSGESVMALFSSLNAEEGLALVVVTHQRYIAEFGERIIRLEDGRVVADERLRPGSASRRSAGGDE